MIDWQQIAKQNGLSREDLEKEILTACSVMGVMRIDEQNDFDALRFTCSDEVGKILLEVRRVEK